MNSFLHRARMRRRIALSLCLIVGWAGTFAAETPGADAITVRVDATNTGQKLLQVSERIPAAPGPMQLLFPRWLPGFHGSYGDVTQIAGLEIEAAGKRSPWLRDPANPFAFVVDVPMGATAIDLRHQSLPAPQSQPYRSPWSKEMLGLQWHGVVLYPAGRPAAEIAMQPSVKLPAGWRLGSALRVRAERDGWVDFDPVSLETLVDSPVYAGLHYRRIELDTAGTPLPATLHLFGDRLGRLQGSEAQIDAHRNLLRQATAVFGSRPWQHDDLLIATGEGLPETALEHQESSENVYVSDYFKDWPTAARRRDVAAHESRTPGTGSTPPGRPVGGGLQHPDAEQPAVGL